MPKLLLRYGIPVLTIAMSVIGAGFAAGVRVGMVEARVTTVEDCAVYTTNQIEAHDARIRDVEAAVALLPNMAQDIREIRTQINDILNILIDQSRER